jgi:hypothetical protein
VRRAAAILVVALAAAVSATAARAGSLDTLPGFTGGPVTAADGETVSIYVQDELLAADPGVPQRFADLLAGLLHGSELSKLTLDLATLDRVRQICGATALGCYSPEEMTIVAIGEDLPGMPARSIVTHEYGHHLANNSTNDPWPAVDWGTKRWASYENVCRRSKNGQLFPGDESENYQFNPGEYFAETYRVLNEHREGVSELPWEVVDASLYPDQTALDALAQDIATPWTGPTSSTVRSTLGPRAIGRGFRVQTPLDGTFRATLRSPSGSRFTLRVVDLATGGQLAYAAAGTSTKSVSLQICGQRSLQIQVRRVRGAGPFSLTVSQP